MSEFTDCFWDGYPKENGIYKIKASDIVNSWIENLSFKDGEWYMLNGDRFPAIVESWLKISE